MSLRSLISTCSLLGMFLIHSSVAEAAPWPEVQLEHFASVPNTIELPTPQAINEAPLDLSTARAAAGFFEYFDFSLSHAQKQALERDKFVLIPIEEIPMIDPMEREPMEVAPEFEQYVQKPEHGLAVYGDEMLYLYTLLDGSWDIAPWRNHFITSDAMTHAWHRFFESALEEVESMELYPRLDHFLADWLGVIRTQRETAAPELSAHWEQIEAQIALALVLLGDDGEEPRRELTSGWDENGDPKIITITSVEERANTYLSDLPDSWKAAAKEELDLIFAKEAMTTSPLFGSYNKDLVQDYTQFTPRSHYAKHQGLRGYFRAMMYLGRNGWPLHGPTLENEARGLSHALLLAESLAATNPDGQPLVDQWKKIMEITSFFAGQSDDVDYPALRRWLAGQTDLDSWTSTQAINPVRLVALGQTVDQLQQPSILSQVRSETSPDDDGEAIKNESLQFRIFGQRFSYDAWVISQLTPPVAQALPSTPTALYVAAALGARPDLAKTWLADQVENKAIALAEFESRLESLHTKLTTLPDADWFSSMATKKLHLIQTLAGEKGVGYPAFMRSEPWQRRQVEGMLGAYTELKHDTLLYAKQSYAEMGEGADPEKVSEDRVPYGYVQPDLRFWAELERLANYTYEGFKKHQLLPNVTEDWGHLGRFRVDVATLRQLANKSATGEAWSIDDRRWLLSFDPNYMALPVNPVNDPGPDDGKNALIADIQTDASRGQVLYEAIGRPYLILALVGDAGINRLVAGTVYNYTELVHPLGERLSDEVWRKSFYRLDPIPMEKPVWTVKPVTE